MQCTMAERLPPRAHRRINYADNRGIFMRFAIAAIATLFLSVSAQASDLDPASQALLKGYVLTLPKVKAYDSATQALSAAEAKDAGLRKDAEAAASEHTKTMMDEVAKYTHHPKVLAFFQKQGLSAQDTALIPLTLMSACMVVQYPSAAKTLSDRTTPGQIGFCKQNMATLKTMKFFRGN